jgi:putative phosphoribosyl transferase
MTEVPFADRAEAGRKLAERLSAGRFPENTIVLALPRGGVPVGFAIARRLKLPLDVLVVRKLGVPWEPELALGAIAGSTCVLDEPLIGELRIRSEEIERMVQRERAEIGRREEIYRGARPPVNVRGRSVILTDDGVATGNTMLAAARCLRGLKPAAVTIAVPVGSREACEQLRTEADDLICLATPAPFFGVGQWYRDFRQVENAEVQDMLAESDRLLRTARRSGAWVYGREEGRSETCGCAT